MKATVLLSGVIAVCTAGMAFGTPIAIVNGDFELDGVDNAAPPAGWVDLSSGASFWTGVVDEQGNPTLAEAPPNAGTYFLTTARQSAGVGSQPVDGLLEQTVDLSTFGALIDVGDQALSIDFIWASDDDRDTGQVALSFYSSADGSGSALGAGYSAPLDAGTGFEFTGWIPTSVGGAVPVSTRSVTIAIATTRTGGSETNIWMDDITGDISVIPEPGVLSLLGIGGLMMGLRRRG